MIKHILTVFVFTVLFTFVSCTGQSTKVTEDTVDMQDTTEVVETEIDTTIVLEEPTVI